MARFEGGLPDELIKVFKDLEVNTEKMLGEMVEAGAQVSLDLVRTKMPKALSAALDDNNIVLSKVYKTPSDDGVNCQVMIVGYFENEDHVRTPAPLVANLFEYGRSTEPYPKQPFFRSSFKKSQITKAMLKVQKKYIEES